METNVSPTNDLLKDLQSKYIQETSSDNILGGVDSLMSAVPQIIKSQEKPGFREYSMDTQDMLYKTLSDGSRIAMYDSYLPGTDNNERLAQQQTTGEKWSNGIKKLLGKTGTAVLGGTAGTVNGLFSMVSDGSMSSLYDNSMSEWLDDLNTKMDYKLPNLYTKQEQEAGFFESLGSANFWANDVLGAATFTIGAIVSEGIWAYATGGASLATTGARWGLKGLGFTKVAQSLNTYKSWVKDSIIKNYRTGVINKQQAINASKFGQGVNTARFLTTSTFYEAGIEAFHFKKEAEENFYSNFESLNGRQPSDEEVAEFRDNLADASNGVFALNTAILMPSNLAMFGSMFNIGSPFKAINKGVNKSLFGVGVEKTAEGTYKAIQATKFQKLAQKTFPVLKSTTIEGLYEEGGQSVASKTMDKWLDSTYDPKQTANTFSMYDAMYDSMAETYGTKEGWKELGIGMIIGGAFGAKGNYSEMTNLKNRQTEIASGENTFVSGKIAQSVMMTNQMQSAIERQKIAQEKGDRVGATIASNEVVMAQIAFKYKMGENLNDLVKEYQTAFDAMTPEEFKKIGVEESQIQEYKDTVISSFANVTNRYEQNREFANRLLGVNKGQWIGARDAKQELHAEALAHTLTVGETANEVMGDIKDEMSKYISMENKSSLDVQEALQTVSQETQLRAQTLVAEVKVLEKQRDAYYETVRKIQNRPKTAGDIEGNRQQGDDYFDASEKLLQVENALSEKEQELNELANAINIEVDKRTDIEKLGLTSEPLRKSEITSDGLKNLEKNLEKLDNLIASYEKSNPRTFDELKRLSQDYKNAQEQFLNYQNASIAMSSGNFKIKASNSWLSRILKSGATMDEFTKEFLGEVYEKYLDTMGMGAGRKQKADDAQTETTTEETETREVDDNKPKQPTEQEIKDTEIAKLQEEKSRIEEQLRNAPSTTNQSETETKKADVERRRQEELRQNLSKTDFAISLFPAFAQSNMSQGGGAYMEVNFGKNNIFRLDTYLTPSAINGQYPSITDGKAQLYGEMSDGTKISLPWNQLKDLLNSIKAVDTKGEVVYEFDINKINAKYDAELKALENQATQSNPQKEQLEKRLGQINNKIKELQSGNISETQALKNRLEEALKNRMFPLNYMGENYSDLALKKPTQAEIDEYGDLFSRGGQINRTEAEQKRFEELNEKLGDWKLLDSAYDSETQSIADIIELIEILETQIEAEQTVDNLDDNVELDQSEVSRVFNSSYQPDSLQNEAGTVTAQIREVNDISTIFFTHLNIETFLEALLQNVATTPQISVVKEITKDSIKLDAPKDLTPKLLEKHSKKEGTKIKVGETEMTIGRSGRISIPVEQYNQVKDLLNMYVFDSGEINWSFSDTFEKLSNGEIVKRGSDYQSIIKNAGESMYELEEGDSVDILVYTNEEFNKDLRDKVLQEVEDNGEVSEETLKEIQTMLSITAVDKREALSHLKATSPQIGTSLGDSNFLLIRHELARAFVEKVKGAGAIAGIPQVIDLGIKAKVKEIFLGTPNLVLEETAQGVKPKEIEISDRALEEVVTQGYIEGDKTVLADKTLEDKVRRSFLGNLVKKNPNSKIPIVVFKRGKHYVAYPVSLNKTESPQGENVQKIINTAQTEVDAVKQINNLLVSLGISPQKYELTTLDPAKIEAITEELNNYKTFTKASDLADAKYDKQSLKDDVRIKIDLTNGGISSPKLKIDLNTIEFGEVDFVETSAVKVREGLVKEFLEIENLIKSSQNLSNKNKFLTAFDENTVRNQPSDISNRADVKLFKSLFFDADMKTKKAIQGDAKDLLGQERIERVRRQLMQLNLLEKQVAQQKKNLATTKNNLQC